MGGERAFKSVGLGVVPCHLPDTPYRAAYLHLYPFRAGALGHYQSLYRDLRLDLFNDDIPAARALHRSLPLHRGGERSRKACEAYQTGSPSGREDWS